MSRLVPRVPFPGVCTRAIPLAEPHLGLLLSLPLVLRVAGFRPAGRAREASSNSAARVCQRKLRKNLSPRDCWRNRTFRVRKQVMIPDCQPFQQVARVITCACVRVRRKGLEWRVLAGTRVHRACARLLDGTCCSLVANTYPKRINAGACGRQGSSCSPFPSLARVRSRVARA